MGFPVARETDIQAQLLAWLNLQPGAFFFRVNSGAIVGSYEGRRRFIKFNSAPGCSDLIGVWRGRFAAIEVKRPGNQPTPRQLAFLERVRRSGGLALVATSLADLEAQLAAAGLP